jgi:hypothetical protein
MNDPTLGRFIQRSDESAVILSFSTAGSMAFLKRAQVAEDASVSQGAPRILARPFGSRFGIGHESRILWTGRLADPDAIVKMPGTQINSVPVADAI